MTRSREESQTHWQVAFSESDRPSLCYEGHKHVTIADYAAILLVDLHDAIDKLFHRRRLAHFKLWDADGSGCTCTFIGQVLSATGSGCGYFNDSGVEMIRCRGTYCNSR